MTEGSNGSEGAYADRAYFAEGAAVGWWWGAVVAAVVLSGFLLGGCASSGNARTAVAASDNGDWSSIPDAVPRAEPLAKTGNPESYKVRGKRYFTKRTSSGHVERGLASWYGKKFHGRKTSSGEPYNMYAMTAAHKTLPLPTYVQVTNVENGRTAVVKVNDRGPFHGSRVIDLSYSAAKKLGVIQKGTAMVEVRAINPLRPAGDPGFSVAAATRGPAKGKRGGPSDPARSTPESTVSSAGAPFLANSAASHRDPKELKDRALDRSLAAIDASPVSVRAPAPAPAVKPTEKAPTPTVADAAGQDLYLQVGAFGDPVNAERLRKRLVASLPQPVRVQRTVSSEPALYKVRIGPLGSEGEARAISAKLVTLGVEQPRRIWN